MLKPSLKPGHARMPRPDGAVLMGARVPGFITEVSDESGLVWMLTGLLDGTRSVDEIAAVMADDHGVTRQDVTEALNVFADNGWLYDAAAPVPEGLPDSDIQRHRRTIDFFSTLEERPRANPFELLTVLRGAGVVVLGAGGVGCAAAAGLVASGVGRIHCVDHDLVELSNLNRQLLYAQGDIGRPKVDVAAERLRALDDVVTVSTSRQLLGGVEDIRAAIEGFDVVLCCADTPTEIYLWTNEACFDARVPMLVAGYTGPKISVGTYIPGATACFACQAAGTVDYKKSQGFPVDEAKPENYNPVIAASAQIAGHTMALEALNLLLDLPVQTAGRELHWHLTDFEHVLFREAVARPECPVACGALLKG